MRAADIADTLREVKAATAVPVTYADVWEFWLRNRDLAAEVDFITIHILPYWEDFPIAADMAGAHVDAIRGQVAAAFPGKDILIGEVGWPSAGRMREGALPSPSNQARVLEEVMARAKAGNYRVNLIEAFDQPWKRQLEGTVGGYWGLLTATRREPKFTWGEPVSDHPWWALAAHRRHRWRRLGVCGRARGASPPGSQGRGSAGAGAGAGWILAAIAASAVAAGICAPWTVENAATESLGPGGWLRGAAFIALAFAAPVAAMAAWRVALPSRPLRGSWADLRRVPATPTRMASGLALVATTILAIQTALGLVFDPRYRDFAFAPLTAAVVPLALAMAAGVAGGTRGAGAGIGTGTGTGTGRSARRGAAETVAAATLAGCGRLHRAQREFRQLAGAVVGGGAGRCSPSLCFGCGTCKAHDQQRRREARTARHCAAPCRTRSRRGRSGTAAATAGSSPARRRRGRPSRTPRSRTGRSRPFG